MIDYWKLTKEYKVGDTVQRVVSSTSGYSLSPFVGRVAAVLHGNVAVRFPHGLERIASAGLVKVNPQIGELFHPTLTNVKSRVASQWKTTELPAGFHQSLAQFWSKCGSDLATYDELWRRYAEYGTEDRTIREEVGKFYLVAKNLFELRLQQHIQKSAAYWAASNRQYRATNQDIGSKRPSCPKCGTGMRKTTYKMDEGARVRLFACPKDLFLVRQTDLLGPGGEPVEW